MKNKYSDLIDQTFHFPTEEFKTTEEGELLYRWNAKISKGVGRRTGAAGREWLIYNEMDIQNYSEELDQSVNELLPSFIGSISTIEDLLEYINENENILDKKKKKISALKSMIKSN